MNVKVNGELLELSRSRTTIADLLVLNQVESPEMVSVQRNGEFVEKTEYAQTLLVENDEVDFLYFMGGGAR